MNGTDDFYTDLAREFCREAGINDPDDQFKALVEEVGELAEEMNRDDGNVGEEIADILVTAFVLAVIREEPIGQIYREKMGYNLKKSGAFDGGKLMDDVA